jgi:hypothetical protein
VTAGVVVGTVLFTGAGALVQPAKNTTPIRKMVSRTISDTSEKRFRPFNPFMSLDQRLSIKTISFLNCKFKNINQLIYKWYTSGNRRHEKK